MCRASAAKPECSRRAQLWGKSKGSEGPERGVCSKIQAIHSFLELPTAALKTETDVKLYVLFVSQ